MKTFLAQIRQLPPTASTVYGLGILIGLLSYELTGSPEFAIFIGGAFKIACPQDAGAVDAAIAVDRTLATAPRATGPSLVFAVCFFALASLAACAGGSSDVTPLLESANSATQQALTKLRATPAGLNILAWAKGGIDQAKADVATFNAQLPGGGLTVDKVKALCGADNSLHTLASVVLPYVPPPAPGINPVGIDNLVYAAIQDGCALATGGAMPSVTQLADLVNGFKSTTGALGIKL